MSRLDDFVDNPRKACWSRVILDSGEPIWISIAQTGVLIKRSKLGLFGATLFRESEILKCADVGDALHREFDDCTVPDGMTNPALRVFTQAALNSKSTLELCGKLDKARHNR